MMLSGAWKAEERIARIMKHCELTAKEVQEEAVEGR